MPDIYIGSRRWKCGDAARPEVLLPDPLRLGLGRRFFFGSGPYDRGSVVRRAQSVEQLAGFGAQFSHGAGARPADAQFCEAFAEPFVVDARQLILSRPYGRHPIGRVLDQPFGIGQADPVYPGRRAALGSAEQPAGVEEDVLDHQET